MRINNKAAVEIVTTYLTQMGHRLPEKTGQYVDRCEILRNRLEPENRRKPFRDREEALSYIRLVANMIVRDGPKWRQRRDVWFSAITK